MLKNYKLLLVTPDDIYEDGVLGIKLNSTVSSDSPN